MRVGVIAIQGDFEKHVNALRNCGVSGLEVIEARTPEDLASVDRAIIPGGESTTVGLLMQRYGMGDALKSAAQDGMPIWGTCMGMILMAQTIVGREQFILGLLNIEVRRNAFGAQINSFEDEVKVVGLDEPVLGVFIRAPVVSKINEPAEVLAKYRGHVVGVRQGNLLGTSFHPELTDDTRLHRYFLEI